MTLKTKKIIAREGLILIGIILFGNILLFTGRKLDSCYGYKLEPISKRYLDKNTGEILHITEEPTGDAPAKRRAITSVKKAGTYTLFIGYPFYLLIRFIVWAIKTLKEK